MRYRTALFVGAILPLALCTLQVPGAEPFDHAHPLLGRTLQMCVRNAQVDYAGLKTRRGPLDEYLNTLATVDERAFGDWSERQQIAFLINAYNAATLQLIIDHHPVRGIKEIGTWLKGPWDQPRVRLCGRTWTLNELEHDILRTRYREPRIHFALVCAARGCPPLRPEAYVASRLDAQLDDQARKFLADAQKNRVESATRTVYLSPIFQWYRDDFGKTQIDLLTALQPFWPALRDDIDAKDVRVRYTDYDWSLNDVTR